MKATALKLLLICALALVFRLALMSLIQNPGINDPVHYYNLGRRLAAGQGFTIDYVWHYSRIPQAITHGVDHWMPLAGVASALGMAAGGVDIQAALTLFLLAGSLLPALIFIAARQLGQDDACALTAAAFGALLPEFALNSLRTDTTIINAFLVALGFVLVNGGLSAGNRLRLLLGGIVFGLAHLTRNDSILLFALLIAWHLLADLRARGRQRLWHIALVILAFGITIAPWHIRNLQEIGSLGSPQTSRMPFMLEPTDLYAYGMPITFESMLERQTIVQLLGKRIFELGAALKQMALSLQLPLVALVPIGVYRLAAAGDRERLRRLAPVLLWIAAMLIIYPILMPVHNQGGSFKKLFISILPLLIPLGALGLRAFVRRERWRSAILCLSLLWLAWSGFALVLESTELADRFHASMRILVQRLESLPDQTGDGEIRLMSQDPYVMSVYGYASVTTPLASREDTLALAQRYEIDYLLMPAARPQLDALYLRDEQDPRFVLVASLPEAGEIPFELYRFEHDAPG